MADSEWEPPVLIPNAVSLARAELQPAEWLAESTVLPRSAVEWVRAVGQWTRPGWSFVEREMRHCYAVFQDSAPKRTPGMVSPSP